MPEEAESGLSTKLVKSDWLIIVALVLLGGGLRVYSLGHAPLWFDELWTWRVSNQPGLGGLFQKLTEDIHLPNYFLLTFVCIKLFGDSEFVMRLPAVIFGILSLPAIYVLGRRLFGRTTGLMAAIMLSLAGASFYYSQEARPYSMMLFFGILTSYLWYQLYERVFVEEAAPGKLLFGLWLALAASCFTHYFCVLLTVFQIAIFGYFAWKQHRGRRVLGALCLGLGVQGLLWIPVLLLQLKNLFSWTQEMDFSRAMADMLGFTFGGGALGASGIYFAGALALCCLLFAFRPGNAAIRSESKREWALGLILVMLWFLPFFVVQFISMTVKPIFVDRYLLFCVPFAFLALSFQISRLHAPVFVQVVLAMLVVGVPGALLESNVSFFTEPVRNGQGDWREVIEKVHEATPTSGKTVVFAITERLGVAQYYFGKLAPDLEIAGEADKAERVDAAFANIEREQPDHVILFFGQMAGQQEFAAFQKAAAELIQVYGQPTPIYFIPHRPIGALLFNSQG